MTDLEQRDNYILSNLYNHFEDATELYGDNVFAVCLQGSQNYGLDIYTDEYKSDIDSKCIILPSFDDFCRTTSPLSYTHERPNKEHIDMKDIRIMFETFRKQNVNFVEILFTDYFVVTDMWKDEFDRLRNMAEDIVHAHPAQTVRTMAGMSMEKKKALKHPYPTIIHKIEKYGYDGKQLHHIIRINDFMKRYVQGEPFKSCLMPSDSVRELLIEAKLNKIPLARAEELADKYDAMNRDIKDSFIELNGDKFNSEPYQELSKLKVDILRKQFKKELCL